MAECSQLTLAEVRARIQDDCAHGRGLETKSIHERHGIWVMCIASESIARIAYEIVDGPVVVMWDEQGPDSDDVAWGLCDPAHLAEVPDRPPSPWYRGSEPVGWSVESLFSTAGLQVSGTVRWNAQIPVQRPGVYVVALTDDPTRTNATLPFAPVSSAAPKKLLSLCADLTVDKETPAADELLDRISSCWLPTETVLYVGKAGTSLGKRVGEYYTTPLGARSPHAGGWFLKTLATLDSLFVHYAISDTPEDHERMMLEAFVESIDPISCPRHPDPDLLLPFANLVMPGGRHKRHGIRGATGCRQTSDKTTPVTQTKAAGQGRRVTLHQEITGILDANGNCWMTTDEIAKAVRARGIYRKRDGTSDVSAFQIHGRTKNYPNLFERKGSRVRRRSDEP